jgi:Alcohol dehydrogenase GroES-like domain
MKVTHSGLCGTDLHYFGYGQVLGHEGVGIVLDVGKNVPKDLFSRGDELGFGIQLSVRDPISRTNIVLWSVFSLSGRSRDLLPKTSDSIITSS